MYARAALPHERLYDNLYPLQGAQSARSTRLAVAEGIFSDICTDLEATPTVDMLTNANRLRDAAAYCLRSVYVSACERDNGTCDQQSLATSTGELHDLGATILKNCSLVYDANYKEFGNIKGALSEIAVATTLVTGIAEGHIAPGFVIFGSSRFDKNYIGLARDVDLRGNIGGRPIKIQVKTSPAKANAIYQNDVVVVSSVQLAKLVKPTANSPLTLLSKVVNGAKERHAAYNFLNGVLPRPVLPKKRKSS